MKQRFIFSCLRYVQPSWYQNLIPSMRDLIWVDYTHLSDDDKLLVDYDLKYVSKHAALRDAAYQAFQKGIMVRDRSQVLLFSGEEPLPVTDEYRFVRKYFHVFWAWYVLLVRLLLLNNPFVEIRGFMRTFRVARVNLFAKTKAYEGYEGYSGEMLERKPLVSVIIPTLNRYHYLRDVLDDLEKQTYSNLEIIVVDQSQPFDDSIYADRSLPLRVIQQTEMALWKARNEAVRHANGELILLYDDDSRVEDNWVEEHIRCLDYFRADISAGVSISAIGSKVPRHYSFFRWADQLDTGNALLRREVFERIGLFDRQFERQRMGDGEFGLRAYLQGITSISNPNASRLHLKAGKGGLRQMGSWDGFRPTSWWAPRPVPSVLYFIRRYFGDRLAVFDLLIKVPASILPLQYKRRPLLLVLASLFSLMLFPVVVIQVVRSWNVSSKMITAGPLVEPLLVNRQKNETVRT